MAKTPLQESLTTGLTSDATGYVWKSVSPSQIDDYRRCPLRWWWSKPGQKPRPKQRSLAFGSTVHAVLEAYLLHGRVPDANANPIPLPETHAAIKQAIADWWERPLAMVDDSNVLAMYHEACPVALAGLKHLPRPEEVNDNDVEREMLIRDKVLPVPVYGRIDLVEPRHTARDGKPLPRVTDHKTTSNFKYLKTPEELRCNAQALSYSFDMVKRLDLQGVPPGPQAFRHVAYRTGKSAPASMTSEIVYDSRNEVADLFYSEIVPDVVKMSVDLHKQPTLVEPNLNACGDYGRCPFRGECAAIGLAVHGATSELFQGLQSLFPSDTPSSNHTTAANAVDPAPDTGDKPMAGMTFAQVMAEQAAKAAASGTATPAPEATKAPETAPAAAAAQAPAHIGPGNKTIESDNATVRFQDGKPVEAAGKVPECALVVAKACGMSLTDATNLVLPLLPPATVLAWRKTVTPETAASAGYGATASKPATTPAVRLVSTQINPPDGTPDSMLGKLEDKKGDKKAAADANRAKLRDGRIIADIKKPELIEAAQVMMAEIGKDSEQEAEYLSRCSLMGASWYNRGPKIPLAADLCQDSALMVAVLTGEPLDNWSTRGEPVKAEKLADQPAPEAATAAVPLHELADADQALHDRACSLVTSDTAAARINALATRDAAQAAVAAQQVTIRDAELTNREDDADDAKAELPALEVKLKRAQKALDTANDAYEKEYLDAIEFVKGEIEAEAEAARLAEPDNSAEDVVEQEPDNRPILEQSVAGGVTALVQGQAPIEGRKCGGGCSPKLYINCFPHGVVWTDLERWVDSYFADAAKAGAVPHHYMIKGYQESAKRVGAHLDVLHTRGELLLPQHMVARTRNLSTNALLEVLVRFYKPECVTEGLG